ncbi:essential MCU regulator, mitochondrial-like [Lycorma delicatula]|uniref:essential MCU regulator, mitochondrial-like n=1 Tax=Lycorma delicatula TaxID=130591 RepID=UPI003F50FBD9
MMAAYRLCNYMKNVNSMLFAKDKKLFWGRSKTTYPSGALLPEPERTPFGLVGVVSAVIPGLLIGAMISKNIASFLEENDLFVPSDDDDDDD